MLQYFIVMIFIFILSLPLFIYRVSIWEKIKMSEKYTSNMPTEEKEIAQPVAWSQLQIWNVSIYFEREKRKLILCINCETKNITIEIEYLQHVRNLDEY